MRFYPLIYKTLIVTFLALTCSLGLGLVELQAKDVASSSDAEFEAFLMELEAAATETCLDRGQRVFEECCRRVDCNRDRNYQVCDTRGSRATRRCIVDFWESIGPLLPYFY